MDVFDRVFTVVYLGRWEVRIKKVILIETVTVDSDVGDIVMLVTDLKCW